MADAYFDIGDYRRQVTTNSPEAQLWFDRGLLWTYIFNPEEAVRCFEKAVEYDPQCAMAHWGIAFASGPNYNKAWRFFDPEDMARVLDVAHGALQRAQEAAVNATAFERDLIAALAPRFPAASTRDPSAQARAWRTCTRTPRPSASPPRLDCRCLRPRCQLRPRAARRATAWPTRWRAWPARWPGSATGRGGHGEGLRR